MAGTQRPGDPGFALDDIVRVLRSCIEDASSPVVADLYVALSRQWRTFAHRRFCDLGDADVEDAIHDTWEKLVEPEQLRRLEAMFGAGRFADLRAFESWAFVVFRNTVFDNGRILRRREELLPDGDLSNVAAAQGRNCVEAAAARRELIARVGEAIGASRIRQGPELFRACLVDGQSDQEAAQALGTTRDSVAGRLKRMRKLIDALGLEEGGW
jgi:RNA polymerase sigma factor (sigma-70 family)